MFLSHRTFLALAIAGAGTSSLLSARMSASPMQRPRIVGADTTTADSAALQFPDTSPFSGRPGGRAEYLSSTETPSQPESKQGGKNPKVVRVLYIGNSSIFENDMPRIFHALMLSGHHPCVVGMATIAGADLAYIWEAGRARRVIQDFPWDYVILQEKVGRDSTSFFYYAKQFHQKILAKHARTILFPQYYQNSDQQMYVDAQNAAVAKVLKAKIAPISAVWRAAIAADSSLGLFEPDGFHPSVRGAYLNALMMYHMITGQSPIGLPHRAEWENIPDRVANILQQAAKADPSNPAARVPLRSGAH